MNKYFQDIKEYIFVYILLIIIFSLVIFCTSNFRINLIQILMILFLIIFGLFLILYYNFNKETRIETLALIIILFFGTCCLFLSPILDICDEDEHFTRADIQSNGQITPVYDENIHRYNASALTNDMILNWHKTLFNTNLTNIQMNHSEIHVSSAFAQNPFYTYLFSSFGVFIAKFFNLTEIWALYLGRFLNLVLYASLVYYSIKKTSVFKIPILVCSCIPLAVYQSASFSVDGFVFAMSFLIISYFLTLSFEEEINRKNILIFYFFVIILSIIKPNYIFFSFLGLLISPNKLEKNDYLIIIFGIISSFIIVLCWTHYSVDALNNSWRAGYFNGMHVNPKEQLDFVLTHKKSVLLLFSSLIYEIPRLIGESFKLSVDKFSYNSPILSWLYGIFFTIFMFLYPIKLKISKKTRLCLLFIVIVIFIGTYFIQYLTWMSVGVLDFSKCGVFPRYFIPLIPLLPLIFNIDINRIKLKNINMWLVVLIITFLFGLLSMIVNQYYFI